MIRKIFLVQHSGVCIYCIDFLQIKSSNTKAISADPQLVSGFFTAILSFGDIQLGNEKEDCNYICFKNLHYYFRKFNDLFIVFELDSTTKLTPGDIFDMIFHVKHLYTHFVENGHIEANCCEFNACNAFEEAIREKIAGLMRKNLFKNLVKTA